MIKISSDWEHHQVISDNFHSDAHEHWSSCLSVTHMNAVTSYQFSTDEKKAQTALGLMTNQ